MKKILMVIASFAIGITANAASFGWGLQSFDYTGPDGSGYNEEMGANLWSGGTAFLFLGTVSYDNGFVSAVEGQTITQIASSGFDSNNFGYGALDISDVSKLPASDAIVAAGGQAYSIVLVDAVVDSLSDKAIKNYVIVNGTSTGEYDPATELSYANFMDTTTSIGGTGVAWAAVPEPTSGLLLLLGMAGLALKRKRA